LEILGRDSLRRNQAQVGQVQPILIEGPARRGEGRFQGRNPANRKVIFKANPRLVGELVPVLITAASVTTLEGELVIREEN
jgi:tRNA-2-methylthio-N6-dimethylallyladenosine synthase